jgi:hypothetical protein
MAKLEKLFKTDARAVTAKRPARKAARLTHS